MKAAWKAFEACILKFRTEDEVIAMANDSEYGLGGAVWTRDINRLSEAPSGFYPVK